MYLSAIQDKKLLSDLTDSWCKGAEAASLLFSFANDNSAPFTAFAATNLPASNGWTSLGSATEISPGQFQFTDTQATNFPQRFYQIRSP